MSHKQVWEAWVTFFNQEDALKAYKEILSNVEYANCQIVEKSPSKLDIYKPEEWKEASRTNPGKVERSPNPEWLIATAHGENCNLIKMSKYLQRKVGGINKSDIKRFGRHSVLIHTKSTKQSLML